MENKFEMKNEKVRKLVVALNNERTLWNLKKEQVIEKFNLDFNKLKGGIR